MALLALKFVSNYVKFCFDDDKFDQHHTQSERTRARPSRSLSIFPQNYFILNRYKDFEGNKILSCYTHMPKMRRFVDLLLKNSMLTCLL